jgi:hypothetical protein
LSDLNSTISDEANFALFLLLLLLTGDRPGVGAASLNGLSSLNHEDITISECCGIFRLQFTGSLKSSKFSSKTIEVDKRIVTFIQKIKRSDGKLFGKLKGNLTNDSRVFKSFRKLFPTFVNAMVRKVAISALFFTKYNILWQNQKAISAKIKTNIIAYAEQNNYKVILQDMLQDISLEFNHSNRYDNRIRCSRINF